mgnify:CR=1 FL=1
MTKYDELCDVAVSNYGLVTAKEIDALGIHLKDVLEWIKLGRIEKRGRGVYRIAHYLPTEYDTYAEAVALVGETAMICGESVLAMHNLALVNPSKITVAATARKRRSLPRWIEVVRPSKNVQRDDFNGIRSQSVADAIRTCKNSLMRERLVSAVIDAKRRGLIDYKEAQELEKELKI